MKKFASILMICSIFAGCNMHFDDSELQKRIIDAQLTAAAAMRKAQETEDARKQELRKMREKLDQARKDLAKLSSRNSGLDEKISGLQEIHQKLEKEIEVKNLHINTLVDWLIRDVEKLKLQVECMKVHTYELDVSNVAKVETGKEQIVPFKKEPELLYARCKEFNMSLQVRVYFGFHTPQSGVLNFGVGERTLLDMAKKNPHAFMWGTYYQEVMSPYPDHFSNDGTAEMTFVFDAPSIKAYCNKYSKCSTCPLGLIVALRLDTKLNYHMRGLVTYQLVENIQ